MFGRMGARGGFGSLGLLGGARSGPIVLTGSPAAVYSSKRLSTYTGPWGRVVRSSDSTEQDIGFVGNIPNVAAMTTFAAGSNLTLKKLYDQSGNANDLIQNTTANQPSISTTALVNGIMPAIFDGVFSGTGKSMAIPSSLSLTRNNFSAFMAIRQVISVEYQAFLEFGAVDWSMFTYGDAPYNNGVVAFDGGIAESLLRPRGQLTTMALRSGAAQVFTVNGTSASKAASSALTLNGGGQIGASVSGATYNLKGDLFALVFYTSSVSGTIHDATLAAFNSAFSIPQSFTTRLVFGGSSLVAAYGSTLNQSPIRKMGLPANVEVYNFGRTNGQTLAVEYTNRAIELGMYDGTKARNIFVMDAPSNDIAGHAAFANVAAAQSFADTLYTGTTLAFVTAILAAGGTAKAVVPTIISRTGFDTTTNFFETARVRYNANVVAGAAANGYTVADRAGNALLGSQTANANLTYFNADAIHPNDAGYSLMAAVDGAAVNPLVL